MSTSASSQKQQKLTFEFTKRKRWADLLVGELAETVVLILSSKAKVLFCSTAVNEVLGWKDEEFVDRHILEFISGTLVAWPL
jgi:hypothetical protein